MSNKMLSVTFLALYLICTLALTDKELAEKFSPLLKFDQVAREFPMDAQVYYEYVINGATDTDLRSYECESATRCENLNIADIVTYYHVFKCTSQVRIAYYWWYGYQRPCISNDIIEEGDHDGDWERVIVTLSLDQTQVAAVTYHQHGGHLTRIKYRNSIEFYNSIKPVVYVGKIAHGSYPDRDRENSIHQCQYFGDWRNPSSTSIWDTSLELYDLSSKSQNWMYDVTFYSGIGTKPHLINPVNEYCNSKSCEGTDLTGAVGFDDAGCYQSDCHALVDNGHLPTQCFKKCGNKCNCDIYALAYCCDKVDFGWFGEGCTCLNYWNCDLKTESNEWYILHNDERLL